jgi:predicted DNA-binding transcriptional regulator AlpA
MQPIKKFFNVPELAEYLGVSEDWVYHRTAPNAAETIPHFKFGKYVKFDPESEEFKAWVQQQCRN